MLRKAGIAPGDWIAVRLRPADAGVVVVADDVAQAIFAAGLLDAWQNLTPGRQRGLLHQIETAQTQPTRIKRISTLLAGLSGAWAAKKP